jgi:hypothetical protein
VNFDLICCNSLATNFAPTLDSLALTAEGQSALSVVVNGVQLGVN